ncbi:RHS repeat-associated core domain-containing protein [Dokdonella sp.]|uniref:RHS repeat-associated core domain-containing protein n=1 Tax=Dokdonella sp. TaxID=2291710 RepID=UPI0025BFEC98|nr:RHS repeat-associated core domain-containing protein [Dokdonella sp.]MBX3688241.1 RHS repeat protein [Dokdonella sp.]
MTGLIDESDVRYATFNYDAQGRATQEWHGADSDPLSIFYDQAGSIVIDAMGAASRRRFITINGILRNAGVDRCSDATCATAVSSSSRTYDANGNPDRDTDFNGDITAHGYNTRGLETIRVDASNDPSAASTSAKRTTVTSWNPNFNVPDQRTVKNASGATESLTRWAYNTRGQPTARCEVDPAIGSATSYTCGSAKNAPVGVRQTRTTYCEQPDVSAGSCPLVGLVTSVNGPRATSDAGTGGFDDTTTYTYYQTDDPTCASGGACPHRHGDLWKVTNALGQVTETVSYDKNGRVTRSKDANGTLTDFAYHPRGWLTDRIVRANANGTRSANDATLHIDYDPVGNVVKVTQPDGDYLAYTYDNAHRLIKIADNLANTIDYCPGGVGSVECLDAAGNRRVEQVKDASGAIKRQLHRVYNQLGQLTQQLNAANAPVESSMGLSENFAGQPAVADGYDGNGNRVLSDDGLGTRTKQQYDGLNRLVATIQNYNGLDTATANTTTHYAYDTRDNLRQVTDPDGLNTVYDYDGLNNLTGLHSPDTGNASYTYDKAGNRITQTDARNVTSTYTYDALNRLTAIAYPDSSLNVGYAYDQPDATTGCSGSYPRGRLTRMTDPTGSTTYCYDRHGNVTKKTQFGTRIVSCLNGTSGCGGDASSFAAGLGVEVGGIANPTKSTTITLVTAMAYTKGDRIQSITYPSGAIISYGRDPLGRITSVQYKANANATAVKLIGSATYYPFGPLHTLTWGNGRTLTKTYDADYAIDSVQATPTGLTLDAITDVMGNVTALSQTLSPAAPDRSYQYDPLYRLSKANAGATTRESYTYSPTGDRTSATVNGATQAYTYTAGTHHLASVGATARSYDANGNTTSNNLAYDQRNRLAGWKLQGGQIGLGGDSARYGYNGKGERTVKQVTYNDHCLAPACYPGPGAPTGWLTGTAAFAYDEAGHLIGEYPSLYGPGRNTEYIYLDSTPIAAIRSGQLHEIETDHLGTPRAVVRPGTTPSADVTVWRWDLLGNTFGADAPNEDADGDGTAFAFSLRYPGQYQDAETGLNYNYFRDYEPGTGRYAESDPTGLGGGINTYAYSFSRPGTFFDRQGNIPQPGFQIPPNYPNPTIVCDGNGGIEPYLTPLSPFDLACFGDCVHQHEMIHIRDFSRANPVVCHGQIRGTMVNEFDNLSLWQTEANAWKAELQCLEKRLEEEKKSDCPACKLRLETEIAHAQDMVNRYTYAIR